MGTRSVVESSIATEHESCREAVRRVLASRTFSKAPRLCSLLEYIVENSLGGNLDNLTEQQIGIQVFKRSPGYNSGEDTIVRGTARHLRQRLDQYYNEEGQSDRLRISVPKGGYVAQFESVVSGVEQTPEPMQPGATSGAVPVSTQAERSGWPLAAKLLTVVLGSAAIVLPLVVYFWLRPAYSPNLTKGPQPLWHALFAVDRKTIIVPGDGSLDTYIAWEQRGVSLEDYANQSYQQQVTVSRPPSKLDVPLSTRSVTPMADLRLVSELVRAPEYMGMPQLERNMEIRYARDVAIADTHDNNLILIGSETFNPWVTLYQPEMDFVAHWDFKSDIYIIDNKAPKNGEKQHYSYDRRLREVQKAITHIALVDNSQGQGRVLVVEGTSMGTTYGAVSFLTHEHLWKPVIDAATDSSGRLRNFEVLLGGDFVHGGVGNTQIIAIHVH